MVIAIVLLGLSVLGVAVSFLLVRGLSSAAVNSKYYIVTAHVGGLTALLLAVTAFILTVTWFYTTCVLVPYPREQYASPATQPSTYLEGQFYATQTLTTVGYGMNLRAAASNRFFILSTVAMLIGGIIWAAVGTAVLASLIVFLSSLMTKVTKAPAPAPPGQKGGSGSPTAGVALSVPANVRLTIKYDGNSNGICVGCSCGWERHLNGYECDLVDITEHVGDHLQSGHPN